METQVIAAKEAKNDTEIQLNITKIIYPDGRIHPDYPVRTIFNYFIKMYHQEYPGQEFEDFGLEERRIARKDDIGDLELYIYSQDMSLEQLLDLSIKVGEVFYGHGFLKKDHPGYYLDEKPVRALEFLE